MCMIWTLLLPSGLQRADDQRPSASRADRRQRLRCGRSGVSRWAHPQFEETLFEDRQRRYRRIQPPPTLQQSRLHLSSTDGESAACSHAALLDSHQPPHIHQHPHTETENRLLNVHTSTEEDKTLQMSDRERSHETNEINTFCEIFFY